MYFGSNAETDNLQWVFVCGCARSGTTVFAELLRSHDNFGIGRERYGRYVRLNGCLSSELFEKHRFCCDLREGDSHHLRLDSYYAQLFDRYEKCTHIGDKIPQLYKRYDVVASAFPDSRFIFLLRSVFDVASSFKDRQSKSKIESSNPWPEWRGVESAVDEWNRSTADTLRFFDSGQVFIARYDQLFLDANLLAEVFGFLEASVTSSVQAFWSAAAKKRLDIEGRRANILSAREREYVSANARFHDYNRLLELHAASL